MGVQIDRLGRDFGQAVCEVLNLDSTWVTRVELESEHLDKVLTISVSFIVDEKDLAAVAVRMARKAEQ